MTYDTALEVLGLTRRASLDEIRTAYREKAKKFHPDLNPGIDEARMVEINRAYEFLSGLKASIDEINMEERIINSYNMSEYMKALCDVLGIDYYLYYREVL